MKIMRNAQIADVAMPIILIGTLMTAPYPVVEILDREAVSGLTSALTGVAESAFVLLQSVLLFSAVTL
jgi:hypothetical protein